MDGLRVLLQIRVRPGTQDEFERLWQAHASYVNGVPGNRGQSLLRHADQSNEYVVLTDWTDEATFRAFERSERQQEYLKRLWPMREGGSMALLTTRYELPSGLVHTQP